MGRSWIGAFLAVSSLCELFPAEAHAHPASGIVVDAKGDVFFIHTGHGVCKIDAQGKLTYIHKVSGGGHFLALDKEGKFASAAFPQLFKRITPAGDKPAILFASGGAPFVVNRDGNLYYGSGFPGGADTAPAGLTVTRMTPDGKRTLFASTLKATLAKMNEAVTGLAAGSDGSLYIACPSAILNVKMDGTVTTLVHPVVVKDCDDYVDANSHSPFFHAPYLRGLEVTAEKTIYAAVTGCRCVVKITPDGTIETIMKSERPWAPTGVAFHDGQAYVLEYTHANDGPDKGWRPRVRKLGRDGKVTTLATIAPEARRPSDQSDSFLGSHAGDEREVAGIKLCWCPPGKFTMGSPPTEPERRPGEDQVEVTLTKGFWAGKYEVTQGQWKRIVGAFPDKQPAGEGNDFPVVWVNYAEAETFCRKLTEQARQSGQLPAGWEFRLPTEAQWEYACRAGTTSATAFGDKLSSKQANFQGKPYNGAEDGPSLNRATKVGSYPANDWGFNDMHGNVVEWCRDWYHHKLPGGTDPDLSSKIGTRNRDGTLSRSRRGSAWTDNGWASRSAFRQRYEPGRRADHIGFRVVAVRP